MSSNINLGLSRINSLLQLLGNPHQSLSAIHIAGTNGKGSVSAYIDFILFKAGFKTGRFNSPHLIDVNDSIRINTKPINRTDYQRIFKYIHNINKLNDIGASEFELMTAVAFWWFNYEKIDVAIVEVGLGGRLDATNVFEKTLVSVITSIGLDHADILGDNVETIAKEKAGILKSEDHIVIAPQSEEIINATLLNYCKDNLLSTTIHPVQPANWGSEESGIASINLSGFNNHLSDDDGNNTLKFYMPLKGDFQLENVATAIKAIDVLRRTDSKFSRITNQHICEGIESTQWFGRLQWIDISKFIDKPLLSPETMMLVDGAHNPPAAKELHISKVQDDEVGDGTTSVCVLAAELLREAEKLVNQKIHPQTIIEGYRIASAASLKALEDSAIDNGSKVLSQDKEYFSNLAVDAVLRLKGSTNLENIQIIKKAGGFILDKKIGVNQPKRIENAKILVANTPMDTDKIKIFGARVRVDATGKLAELERAERVNYNFQSINLEKVEKIKSHGINCFVNRQLIYNWPEQLFADAGIMSIEHADFDGVERLALVTGGEIASTFDHPELVKLGHCDLIEEVIIGNDAHYTMCAFLEICKLPITNVSPPEIKS
ncbi:11531_t:CDS:10 [Entrophospora sp. SA101]|nr:11531_t:CDS:10 [Entrophospora sp. SA101]